MATRQPNRILEPLVQVLFPRDGGGLTDEQLVESFVARQDQAAFAALVRRHGPMVLGVCRRVVGHTQDAEDAFQAVFLVLARKAATLTARESVGNWLYGVAYRTSLRARAVGTRRRAKEKQVTAMPHPSVEPEGFWNELEPLLAQELSRLPDKYRVPLVLCDLEGRTRREVARQLGVPDSTLSNRLATGRRMLARRLASRGVALSGGVLAAALARKAVAAVPTSLGTSVVKAAAQIASGGATASAVSAGAVALYQGVMKAMFLKKLISTASLLLLITLALGLGVVLGPGPAEGSGSAVRPAARADNKPKPPDPAKAGRIFFHHNQDLVSVQPDGEKRQALAGVAAADAHYYQVLSDRLSPDGKWMAFGRAVIKEDNGQVGVHPPEAIFVRDVSKSDPADEVVKMAGQEINGFCWSPDGARLAFSSWDADNSTRNWVVDVKTKKVEEVKLPRFKADDKEYAMSIQAWAPDGKSFLVLGRGLHTVKSDGTGLKAVTKEQKGILGGSCQFSPDGKQVLFVVVHEAGHMTLHVADTAGGKEKALVDAKNFTDLHACWSPDGRRIAYTVTPLDTDGKREGETSLFVVDADGENSVQLMTEKHDPGVIHMRLIAWR